jgi:Flp pilus assembly protein CpaB
MQAPRNMFSTTEIRRQLSTRQGTFVLAAVVTVAAAAFLLIFLSQYRARVTDSSEVNVMVASSLIEKGSSGDVIVEKSLFQMDKVQKSDLKANAVTDPAKLRGQVASEDVFPGEQITASQFKSGTNSFAEKITGVERGISIPLDSAHGMIGDIKTGDRVDVLGGFNATSGFRGRPSLRMILRDALVLKAPEKASSSVALNKTQNVVVRAPDSKAAEIAFAVDNGKVWLTLRPKAGAENSPQELIRLEQLLAGTRPIKVNREEGR